MNESVAGVSGSRSSTLFQLLRFSSPTLPIGGFAWSQGLESAIEQQWLKDSAGLTEWLAALLEHNFARQELPLLARLLSARDLAGQKFWNARALAMRETAELRLEDEQSGAALLRLASSLEMEAALDWPAGEPISYVCAYALVCRHHGLEFDGAAVGMIWSWLDNQVAAAIKLIPLGQTEGQKVIETLSGQIAGVLAQAANVGDADIGISLPGQVMASMLHENQYSRLFRS